MAITNSASKNRHAYLIIAHGNIKILEMLLSAIDDDRNDIFVHVDKKAEGFPFAEIRDTVHRSKITFIERISVNWGGYSLAKVEFELLKEATKTEHAYYYLLSGVDFPLKSQDAIHCFLVRMQERSLLHLIDVQSVWRNLKIELGTIIGFKTKSGATRGK